jgi:hypothetical protein
MTQEQLRMQMLAGIITESEYKAKLNEGKTIKIGDFIYKTTNKRPEINDWILKFKQVNQLDFKSGELKEKDFKYFPIKLPMLSFLNPEDLKIIATNDPKLIKDGVPSLSINESQSIMFKSKKYYIDNPEGKEKVFAYNDPELKQVAQLNGKTLMFKTTDIEDMLIK